MESQSLSHLSWNLRALAIHHVVNPEMNAEEPSITHKKEMTPINNLSMAWTFIFLFPFLSLVVQAQEGCGRPSTIPDRRLKEE